MENRIINISLSNYNRLTEIGDETESFEDIISKVLDEYEEYQEIKDLIEADNEFDHGKSIHFSSLAELDKI